MNDPDLIRQLDELHEERKLLLANLKREQRYRDLLRSQLKHVLPHVRLKDGREGLSLGDGPHGHAGVLLILIDDESFAGYLNKTEME